MKLTDWRWIKGIPKLLATQPAEPARQAERVVAMQLHIVLPAKAGVIGVVLYHLFDSGWFDESVSIHFMVAEMLRSYFFLYVLCNVLAALAFRWWRRFPPNVFPGLAFALGLLDGLFISGLTFLTDGFESMAFWLYPGLIVLNAISIPLATLQIVLNFLLSMFYLWAGVLEARVPVPILMNPPPPVRQPAVPRVPDPPIGTNDLAAQGSNQVARIRARGFSLGYDDTPQKEVGSFLPQLCVLWLLTVCCYGVQILAERQRRMLEEAREFAMLEGQLKSAGRLAAEVAHQLKNPLGIINNAVFSLQRSLNDGKAAATGQIEIIQEEISRADRILTDLMGYAQLNEGRVEKLNIAEEIDLALGQVLPPGAGYKIAIRRNFARELPPLLMQRRHLNEILVNILQNSREAMQGQGSITVTATCQQPTYALEVLITDDGPGVPPEKVGKIFEAYYTTKEKGTGLGLAIVKHNMELYGGSARVESELGKGARFILLFPGKSVISLAKQR